ncbi:MAG TPA: glycosyltransferase family 4 protein [Acidimicrobiales bacterium]|nr:glycosyltransferase family 4 protein [Acidimicrobiales bacterium]
MDVEPDLVGLHDSTAGLDGDVVEQMERLVLGPETEEKMDHAGNQRRPAILVLSPTTPSATGNGLAMRAESMVAAAGRAHDVCLVVVALLRTGAATPSAVPGLVAVHHLAPTRTDPPTAMADWLSDPRWRERLPALVPLPDPSSFASPVHAAEVAALPGGVRVRAVLALRLSMALLGMAVSEQLGVPLIVDADDDDVDLLRRQGRKDEAAAWSRLGTLCLRSAALVTVAGAPDAVGIRHRYGLSNEVEVEVVPNSVVVPSPSTLVPRPNDRRILFLGNLTYEPNIEGAGWLVGNVLQLLDDRWSVDLVGSPGPAIETLAGPRVAVRGHVHDVADAYARADVAVAPLLKGSGTRIKVIEAMAYGRPVVATTAGCAGIDAVPGTHLLVADRPDDFARRVSSLEDPALADRLVASAAELVARSYDSTTVIESASSLFRSVTSVIGTGESGDPGTERGQRPT